MIIIDDFVKAGHVIKRPAKVCFVKTVEGHATILPCRPTLAGYYLTDNGFYFYISYHLKVRSISRYGYSAAYLAAGKQWENANGLALDAAAQQRRQRWVARQLGMVTDCIEEA